MSDIQELLPMLRELRNDPELREFIPLLNEMIAGAETPGYDNTERVMQLFLQNDLAYHCRKITEHLFYANMFLAPPRKKWYEVDDKLF